MITWVTSLALPIRMPGKHPITYNGFGQLMTQTDAKGQVTTCAYDNAGRIKSKTGAGLTASYVYSSSAGSLGLLQSASRDNVTETYTYDALCRTKTVNTNGPVAREISTTIS